MMAFSSLIAWYLFLGGAAAGAFAVMAAVDLRFSFLQSRARRFESAPRWRLDRRFHVRTRKRLARAVYTVALVMLAFGALCLLADLGRPEAFLLLFLHPTSSLVTVGSFALVLLMACLVVVAAESLLVLGPAWRKAALAAEALGLVLAVVVMAYTGLLLQSVVAVGIWQSGWLPVLFVFSSLSCGCAVVLIVACLCEGYEGVRAWMRSLAAIDVVFVAAEAVAVVALALALNGGDAQRPFDALLFGDQSPAFWFGFVGCGILAPLAIELPVLARRIDRRTSAAAAQALFVLVGGFALRFVLVSAGIHPGF